MEHYTFYYLVGSLAFLIVWIILYIARKDLRKKMLWVSLLFGAWAPISAIADSVQWWHPPTITGTRVGIEDFILGFSISGIASVLYEEIYRKRMRNRKEKVMRFPFFFLLSVLLLYFVLVYALNINSFYGMMGAGLFGIICITLLRKDLLKDSVVSGLLMLLVGLPIYFLLFIPYPEYVTRFWILDDTWHTFLLLGIPVKEYLWLFVTGMLVGPFYEFIQDKKVVSMPRA